MRVPQILLTVGRGWGETPPMRYAKAAVHLVLKGLGVLVGSFLFIAVGGMIFAQAPLFILGALFAIGAMNYKRGIRYY
jgi:hypothetical protein